MLSVNKKSRVESSSRKMPEDNLPEPVFTLLACEDTSSSCAGVIIKAHLYPKYTFRMIRFRSASQLLKLTFEQPFDLIFLHLGVLRNGGGGVMEFLMEITYRCRKPVLVTQGINRAKLFEGTGATFIQAPFSLNEIVDILREKCPGLIIDKPLKYGV